MGRNFTCIEKDTVQRTNGHERPEGEWRYSFTLSLTLALNGGGWLTPQPGRFTPRKETRFPFYRRLGEPQCQAVQVQKTSLLGGFDRFGSESLYRLRNPGSHLTNICSEYVEIKCQLDATEVFIADLIACSTC